MSRTLKFATALGAVVLAPILFTGCTAAASPQSAEPSLKPVASDAPKTSNTPAPSPSETDTCPDPAWINMTPMSVSISGDITDLGARKFAEGRVGFDDDGNISTYTVAPGDVPAVIGERLCITNGLVLGVMNHVRVIQPDQVLWLRPDTGVPWVPYYNPDDAPGGFHQIPYQHAIEAMGAAADAGDVDTMRDIWSNELKKMFFTKENIDMIQGQLDAGDLDALRQMFS